MKPFKWMFEEQNATEIEYKGKQVSSFYRYDKKGKYRLKFTFVSTNSQHEQSIILHLDGFKGKIFWNGKRLKKERRRFPQIIFEETWAPKEFELEVILEDGDIEISNGCLRCRTDFADIQNKKECGGNRQWQNHYLRNWAANTKGKGII